MPKEIKPRWCERDRAWLVPLGTYDEKNRRRRYVPLRDEHGRKIGEHDHAGRTLALARAIECESQAVERGRGITVRELMLQYLAWHRAKGSKASTIETHRFHLTKFGDYCHAGVPYYDRAAASIDVPDLTRFRKQMETKGAQPGYVKLMYASVLACWRWACRPIEDREPIRLLERNPFEELPRPKRGRGRTLVIPWPTIQQLVVFAFERNRQEAPKDGHWNKRVATNRERFRDFQKCVMLRIVAESGPRPHEVAALEWTWLTPNRRLIKMPPEEHKTGWRTERERKIPLTDEVAELLKQLEASGKCHSRWVFGLAGEKRTKAPTRRKFNDWFRKLRDDAITAGVPLPVKTVPYVLRHSLVTQAREGGIHYADIAPPMGHDATTAERHYGHMGDNAIIELFERIDRARRRDVTGENPTEPSSAE